LITRIALGPGSDKNVPTVISLVNHEWDNETYVLGTLRGEICEQFELDVNICSDSTVTLKVEGPGTVHFVGYYNRLASYSDDGYSDLSDEEVYSDEESGSNSEDDEINARVHAYMGGDDPSSGEDYQEEGGNVEELSDLSDSDVEEVPLKSPVKQKNPPFIQPKPAESKPTVQPAKKPFSLLSASPTTVQHKAPVNSSPAKPVLEVAEKKKIANPGSSQGQNSQGQVQGEKKKKKKNKNNQNSQGPAQGASNSQKQNPNVQAQGEKKKKKKNKNKGGNQDQKQKRDDGDGGNQANKKQKTV